MCLLDWVYPFVTIHTIFNRNWLKNWNKFRSLDKCEKIFDTTKFNAYVSMTTFHVVIITKFRFTAQKIKKSLIEIVQFLYFFILHFSKQV